MIDENLPEVSDGTNINDSRLPNEFNGISFSNYKKLTVRNNFIGDMIKGKIEPACYWCCELICAGHFMDVWENILHYAGKHIHIGNPKVIIYLEKRFLLFQSIINEGNFSYPHQLRNHPTIRKLFAEIVSTLTLSNRKHSFEPIRIKRKDTVKVSGQITRTFNVVINYPMAIIDNSETSREWVTITEHKVIGYGG